MELLKAAYCTWTSVFSAIYLFHGVGDGGNPGPHTFRANTLPLSSTLSLLHSEIGVLTVISLQTFTRV